MSGLFSDSCCKCLILCEIRDPLIVVLLEHSRRARPSEIAPGAWQRMTTALEVDPRLPCRALFVENCVELVCNAVCSLEAMTFADTGWRVAVATIGRREGLATSPIWRDYVERTDGARATSAARRRRRVSHVGGVCTRCDSAPRDPFESRLHSR